MTRVAASMVLAVLLASCAAATPIRNGRSLEPSPGYIKSLQNATRRDEHLQDMELHTYVYATLVTPAFAEAFDAEYRDVYGAAAAAPALAANGDRTVILSLATNDRAISDITSFGKLWTLTYSDGTTTVTPRRIDKYPQDALFMRYFFPYWSPWQETYRVSFPLPASTTTGGALELNGVGGRIRLAW